MFIKGKYYIIKASGCEITSSRDGLKNKVSLTLLDETGRIFRSYSLSQNVAEEVISGITDKLLVTPTTANCVIDIEKRIEKVKKNKGEENDKHKI